MWFWGGGGRGAEGLEKMNVFALPWKEVYVMSQILRYSPSQYLANVGNLIVSDLFYLQWYIQTEFEILT